MDSLDTWSHQLENFRNSQQKSENWRVLLIIILGFMLVATTVSVLKMGYQLTILATKLAIFFVLSLVEIGMLIILIYPTRGLHKVVILLEKLLGLFVVRFLESRISNSYFYRALMTVWEMICSLKNSDNNNREKYNGEKLEQKMSLNEERVHIY
ncbi:TPA_asm: P6 [Nitraria betacytorhabdovirus 1]|nr:TPA_asm: P6 [Nitraria betacytorhabdovirus 1]